jgi:predicted DNA-binding protein (MmcQ/YjbR family)
MAKKKAAKKNSARKATVPVTCFRDVLRGRSQAVQKLANSLRELVYEELPDAEERFIGGRAAMALYRSTSDVCGIQPCDDRCNFHFTRGVDLTDKDELLEGTGQSIRHVKAWQGDDLDETPIREWIRESVVLNRKTIGNGPTFNRVLKKLQEFCLALPNTKETMTWGIPHFRVGEKIFCGCGEQAGRVTVGMKADRADQKTLIKLPGIEVAPYSGHNGWITIDPGIFTEWKEIEDLILDSFRLIAPKRTVALLDSPQSPLSRKKANAKRESGRGKKP